MAVILKITAFAESAAEFDKAISWIRSFGLDPHKGRFSDYHKALAALAQVKTLKDARRVLVKLEYAELVNALYEVKELVMIYRGFSNLNVPGLRGKLREYIKGPRSTERETLRSHKPRDFGFELRIGAHFAASSFKVDYPNSADLQIDHDDKTVFVECKRPSSIESLEERVKDAFDQLTERYENCTGGKPKRGIVALSISKLKNPHNKLVLANTGETLGKMLSATIKRFAIEHQMYWERELDIRTIGLIIHFQTTALIEDLNLITPAQRFGWWYKALHRSSDYYNFHDITRKLTESFSMLTN